MFEFEKIASSEGMHRVYQTVVGKIDLVNHPDFSNKPIKVLDLGGGIGAPGRILKRQCEVVFGEFPDEELGTLVDYVNVDKDSSALEQSPGRKIYGNTINIHEHFAGEEPFDYVLSINQNPDAPVYTTEELDRRGISGGLFGNNVYQNLLNATETIRNLTIRIGLLSSALLLKTGGLYIWTGVIGQESLDGTIKLSKECGLGIKKREDPVHIDLGKETIDLLLEFDGDEKGRKRFGKMQSLYRQNYRVVSMYAGGVVDRNKVQSALTETIDNYYKWMEYCELQDRFGDW